MPHPQPSPTPADVEGSHPRAAQPLETGWERHSVQPASAVYIGRDDRLVVRSWGSVTGAVLQVRGRHQLPSGQVIPFAFRHAPNSDRSPATSRHDLAEGFLLALAVEETDVTPRRGSLFVQVAIDRGGTVGGVFTELLVSDYVSEAALVGWPGGILRSSVDGPGALRAVTGTDPAAGSEISETVPTNARWRLHGLRVALVTSAVAGTRRVHVLVDDGTTVQLDLAAADTQAASLTRNYNAAPDGFARAAQDSEIYVPLPGPIELLQGWRVRTSTTALDAGDNFGAPQLRVEEWIED